MFVFYQDFDEIQCENLLEELELGPRSFTDYCVKELSGVLPKAPESNAETITELYTKYLGNYGDG